MVGRLRLYRFYLRLVCATLPLLAFLITWYIRFHLISSAASQLDWRIYLYLLLLTTFVWSIMARHYQVVSIDELFRERTGVRAAFPACVATYTIVLVSLFFIRNASVSRVFILLSAFVLLVLTLCMRAVFRSVVRRHTDHRTPLRLLIVGADQYARRAALCLVRGPFSVCRVVAHVALPGQNIAVKNAPVYEFSNLKELDIQDTVDEVILALPPTEYSGIPMLLKALEAYCLPVRAIVDMGENVVIRDRLFQFGRLQMLDLDTTPIDSLHYSILKRGFDVIFATFVLVLSAPLMAAIAAAIRLTSPGPVLFLQPRVGLNGRVFNMYKFRTMKVAPQAISDTIWTTANDPRRTRLGAFLRRTNLDELPQFFNVLKGDMSVVGPRPERPHFVQKFLQDVARYNNRHRLKVGITGWAQVNGWRGDTSIKKRIEYDLYYLQNWSFGFDIRIICLTFLWGFSGKNAY